MSSENDINLIGLSQANRMLEVAESENKATELVVKIMELKRTKKIMKRFYEHQNMKKKELIQNYNYIVDDIRRIKIIEKDARNKCKALLNEAAHEKQENVHHRSDPGDKKILEWQGKIDRTIDLIKKIEEKLAAMDDEETLNRKIAEERLALNRLEAEPQQYAEQATAPQESRNTFFNNFFESE